jgi:uncharacterized coiled-coil protein SlyX
LSIISDRRGAENLSPRSAAAAEWLEIFMNDSPDNDDAARVVALEERLTFQQRQIDELSAVALDHRRELDALNRELAQCRAALDLLRQSGAGENLPHEKPPHY